MTRQELESAVVGKGDGAVDGVGIYMTAKALVSDYGKEEATPAKPALFDEYERMFFISKDRRSNTSDQTSYFLESYVSGAASTVHAILTPEGIFAPDGTKMSAKEAEEYRNKVYFHKNLLLAK